METVYNLDPSTVDGLQELCKLCHDSAEGYRTAADQLKPGNLQQAFRNTAEEREHSRQKLADFLATSNEKVPEDGTVLGSAHRWWINARTALTDNNEQAVLAEAIRGESHIEDEFKSVLRDTTGSPANEVLQDQLTKILACRKALEDIQQRRN